jgi:hypothetical protein
MNGYDSDHRIPAPLVTIERDIETPAGVVTVTTRQWENREAAAHCRLCPECLLVHEVCQTVTERGLSSSCPAS